jgi:hypothetical protein
MTMQPATQCTGGSAISYYIPEIFTLVGFTTQRSLLIQSIGNIIGLLGEISCILLVDKLGHRWPLILGSIAMSITFIISSDMIVRFPASKPNTSAHWVFTVTTQVFSFVYAAPAGSISWCVP